MVASIDLGSLIVAVVAAVFVFNPQIAWCLKWIYMRFRSLVTPDDVKCELLLWKDISGSLHTHSGSGNHDTCTYCGIAKTHPDSEKCWHRTLAQVFNNAWGSTTRRTHSRKPAKLPLNEHFLQTEARVILAYLICTARINYFKSSMLGNSLQYVDLKEKDGLIIGHIGHAAKVVDLTKEELERILEGWPPFYRKTFVTREGHVVDSPTKTFGHLRRPGWIVAIGLGSVQPTDVYIDDSKDKGQGLFAFAIQRSQRILQVQFENEWRGDKHLQAALESVKSMLSAGYSAEHILPDPDPDAEKGDTIAYPKFDAQSKLTKTQCEALMRVFNNMVITAQDKAIIDPVLEQCLERVKVGIAIALKYHSSDRVLRIPPLLQGDKKIYLRGCKRDDDD